MKVFSNWDSFIKEKWPLLNSLPSQGSFTNNVDKIIARKEARWSPPPSNWFKISYDGASRGNPRKSGVGAVISDENSNIIKEVCKTLPIGTNNYAELEALSMGLDIAISLGIKDIIIEGDSMVTFQAVSNKKTHVWTLQYILDKILLQLNFFTSYIISHVYRECNGVVDFLANKAIDNQVSYGEFEDNLIPTFNKNV